jgi:hypothetical protein
MVLLVRGNFSDSINENNILKVLPLVIKLNQKTLS